ncbi:dnaJ homolog subfamily C member 21-like [Mercenaria mercenaria]|uniref:dnaJ homolog subfamily C member 21-like n=1 Tax=Mercenaria mercenaria TaxID=6596 RepID=UPI001E1DD55F|nr:dnaJ homolog subfamily C member 21-like [Mercenaria mercenaria]XP_045158964.1 dnaJ homolog subfamily C member 21-like [Mercenaria mercenaria]XP_053394598.1 dnaJ homolog subfamily C member 21-like [Mercenaria mercenaria]
MSPMKCHYEVLGVQRDASADDLKKAYRKLALKWHPDKNPDNIDECTQQFRLVQQAYEVLGDPQERAWYDKHREAILRGGHGHGDKYEDNCLDVFQYFNSSCYKGFGDDKEGFYAVYDEVFKTLAEEDRQFVEEEDFVVFDFGDSNSVYEEVVKPFYDYWESYCTAKSYVWVEKYDTREAPERRVRRLMEAENKKLRDAAKKERNEEIRALAKYVKKRDKRVQEYKKKLEERAEEIKQKAKEHRERHLEEGRKKMENYKEAEWSSASGLEDHYKELEAKYDQQFGEENESNGDDEDEQEEIYYDDLYCVACDRMFKNEKTYKNHEKSKKHKEFVAIIKAHMAEEEAGLSEEVDGGTDRLTAELLEEGEELEENNAPQRLSKKQKKKRKQQKNAAEADNVDISDNLEETKCDLNVEENTNKNRSKREKRREKKNRFLLDSDDEEEMTVNGDMETEVTNNIVDNDETKVLDSDTETSEQAKDSEHIEGVCDRLTEIDLSSQCVNLQTDSAAPELESENIPAEQFAEKQTKKNKKENKPDPSQKPGSCGICHEEFQSRSKLFQHIKETGHAMLKNAPDLKEQSSQKQGKKNKKKKGK